MADILNTEENYNPKLGLKNIYAKLLEIIAKVNTLWSNAPTVTPKVYKALLTQTGTDAPVATVLVNTLSGTPVWSYVGVGDYELTLASEWTVNKTGIIHKSIISDDVNYKLTSIYTSSSVLNFKTFDTTTSSNDMLLNAELITIEVYP